MLEELCALTADEGHAGQHAFFERVLGGILAAQDAEDLAGPFMELSTSAFLGFDYAPGTALLLDRVLEEAQRLAESLAVDARDVH